MKNTHSVQYYILLCCIACTLCNFKVPIFRVPFGKSYAGAEKNYTGTVCGACEKYKVWVDGG